MVILLLGRCYHPPFPCPMLTSYRKQDLVWILTETKVNIISLDHHLVGDLYYLNKIEEVYKKAKSLNKNIITAAEFLGKEPEFLEARRKEFYKEEKKMRE
jgi:predicted metallo-beta-lactamase superfamily hydrolase